MLLSISLKKKKTKNPLLSAHALLATTPDPSRVVCLHSLEDVSHFLLEAPGPAFLCQHSTRTATDEVSTSLHLEGSDDRSHVPRPTCSSDGADHSPASNTPSTWLPEWHSSPRPSTSAQAPPLLPHSLTLRPVLFSVSTPPLLVTSPNLMVSNTRMTLQMISLAQTSLLNSRLLYSTLYSTSPPGCLIGISNIIR